jgi:4-amino-4-deoxychorismate lyase
MPDLEIIRRGSFRPWLGVFETVCVRRGQPIFLEEHWGTLLRACAVLGLKRPFDFRKAARALPISDGRWRWVVGPDGSSHSFQREKPLHPGGLTLRLSTVRVGSCNWDTRHKTLSYLGHWQARAENPSGEALLLNEHRHIVGGAMSNVFWVRRGRLHTPAEASGCRSGVVRAWVLEQAAVRLVSSRPSVLDSADEIFATNSMLGICPISRWEGRALKTGPVTRMLRQKYAQLLRTI